MLNRKMWLLTALSSLALAGAAHAGSEASGVPNPAGSNCARAGGSIEIFTTDAGEMGLCRFPSGGMIEEWTLFYSMRNPTPNLAVKTFLAHPEEKPDVNGNPAALYCGKVGGQYQPIKAQDGSEGGLCMFDGHYGIEEWTLFGGPKDPRNAELTKLLQK